MTPNLTREQADTLKTLVLAAAQSDPTLAAAMAQATQDDRVVAAWFNVDASPAYPVWKTRVTEMEMHAAYVWTEMDNLAQAKFNQLTLLLKPGYVNPSVPNIRQGLADIFAGAQLSATRAAMIALAKRNASRAERALAGAPDGTGTATMSVEGPVTTADVSYILRG